MSAEMTNEEKLKELRQFVEEVVRPKRDDAVLDHMYQDSCSHFLKYATTPYRRIVGFGFLLTAMRLGEVEKDFEFSSRCFEEMKSSVLSHVANLYKEKGIHSKLAAAFRIFEDPDIDLPDIDLYKLENFYDRHPYNFYCQLIHLKMELPQIQVYYLALAALWLYEERMSGEEV